ncbi:hypothetical protein M123_2029 [Bacteroides fragilis str. 3976T8]|uniref:Uncharacterized protein n=1 Tax=Bacteroides fragilis str. 3976T8 TaxID=1339314 RepID=A0A016BXK5_BACFG|nr:hypothetical protein M123_2029 [Bacteroides fragilis str. 3976T8]
MPLMRKKIFYDMQLFFLLTLSTKDLSLCHEARIYKSYKIFRQILYENIRYTQQILFFLAVIDVDAR